MYVGIVLAYLHAYLHVHMHLHTYMNETYARVRSLTFEVIYIVSFLQSLILIVQQQAAVFLFVFLPFITHPFSLT